MAKYEIPESVCILDRFEPVTSSPAEEEAAFGIHNRREYRDDDSRIFDISHYGNMQIASTLLPIQDRYSTPGYLVSVAFSDSLPTFEKDVNETVSTIHCRADYYGVRGKAATFFFRAPESEDYSRRLGWVDLEMYDLPGDDPLPFIDTSKDSLSRDQSPYSSFGISVSFTRSPETFEK